MSNEHLNYNDADFDPIDRAEMVSDWLGDYVAGFIDEPASELPPLALQRLEEHFPGHDDQLAVMRHRLLSLGSHHQLNLTAYFSGFPDEFLEAVAINVTMAESVEVLDLNLAMAYRRARVRFESMQRILRKLNVPGFEPVPEPRAGEPTSLYIGLTQDDIRRQSTIKQELDHHNLLASETMAQRHERLNNKRDNTTS